MLVIKLEKTENCSLVRMKDLRLLFKKWKENLAKSNHLMREIDAYGMVNSSF